MEITDFIKKTERKSSSSAADFIRAHKQSGTLGESVQFYEPVRTFDFSETEEQDDALPSENFFERIAKSAKALQSGKISFTDVAREVPGAAVDVADTIASTLAPGGTNFFKTTGSILGEGLAYAVDPNVRKQYLAGNLDILPTITNVTQADLAKYTFAAGLETAIFRSFPNIAKTKLLGIPQMRILPRFGAGTLQGVGFAISEGLANDRTPEEILKSLPAYGVSGGVISVITPYLMPLLRAEATKMPAEIKNIFKRIQQEIKPRPPLKVNVVSQTPQSTRVPISTPNSRYEKYLRSQGYEPYIPDEVLPTIDMGPKPISPKTGLPTIKLGQTTPKVFDEFEEYSRAQGYEPYMPDEALPTVDELKNPVKKYREEKQMTRMVFDDEVPQTAETPTPKTAEAPTPKTAETPAPQVTDGARVTQVPSNQLPVGSGDREFSRLERRVRGFLEETNTSKLDEAGLQTYNRVSKPEQIKAATQYVLNNQEDALAVLAGGKEPPEGLLQNSIAIALEKHAESSADSSLALRLASLRSTRAGQEISMLTEIAENSAVRHIDEIVEARKSRYVKKVKGDKKSVSKAVNKEVKNLEKEVNKDMIKVAEAEQILNDLLC